ncbi:MAG: hypothetical protein DMG91_01960 [Acidobacteria bacterium]|nr:MAG: hypothetical protein DMG91_01960 [Acidobacteriota bacterium]
MLRRNLLESGFTEWQHHVRQRCPDKHRDRAQHPGQKNTLVHVVSFSGVHYATTRGFWKADSA